MATREAAELSSLATALDELARRITAIAEALAGTASDDVAAGLFDVERALGAARRRLARLVDARDGGRREHRRGHPTVGSRRHTQGQLAHARNPRR